MCGRYIQICLGNKIKVNANMTWKHKYGFVCISVKHITSRNIPGTKCKYSHGGDTHAVRALPDGIRMSPECSPSLGRPNGCAACFRELQKQLEK